MDRSRFGASCFRAGAVLLLILAIGHGFGHYQGRTQTITDEAERRVHTVMYGEKFDLGGTPRSLGELMDGFSLFVSLGLSAIACLCLTIATRSRRDPALLRSASVVNLIWLAPTLGVSLAYWFIAPTSLLALALACNGAAWWLIPNDYY